MDNPATTSAGNRIEAERLLSIAENLLQTRDLAGSREFAVLAQETEPLLDGSDQILSICDVLLAGDKRISLTGPGINNINSNQNDWYGILQVDRRSNDLDLIKKNYRRLALLLHPDKNKYPHANSAFRLVADAWAILSDQSKKSAYDAELSHFSRVELTPRPPQSQPQSDKLPVRRSPRGGGAGGGGDGGTPNDRVDGRSGVAAAGGSRSSNFWTACPYCYVLYEYPRVYEDCCLRCQSCERAFHAAVVPSLPPMVPGKEAYYCCWGFFPLGFSVAGSDGKKGVPNSNAGAFPEWMPPLFSGGQAGDTAKAAPAPAPAPPPPPPPPPPPASSPSPAPAAAAPGARGMENQPQVRRENMGGMPDGSASADIRQAANAMGTPVAAVAGGGADGMPVQKKRGRPRKNPV